MQLKKLKELVDLGVISEEEFNNAEFDVTDYVNKKIKKAWFEKALEFHTRPFNFPFNNVK